jgi:hypothetical protein
LWDHTWLYKLVIQYLSTQNIAKVNFCEAFVRGVVVTAPMSREAIRGRRGWDGTGWASTIVILDIGQLWHAGTRQLRGVPGIGGRRGRRQASKGLRGHARAGARGLGGDRIAIGGRARDTDALWIGGVSIMAAAGEADDIPSTLFRLFSDGSIIIAAIPACRCIAAKKPRA